MSVDYDELKKLMLGNWHQLNAALEEADSLTVYNCLLIEFATKRRPYFIERLHTRFMSLRKKELQTSLLAFTDEAETHDYSIDQVAERFKDFYYL